MTEYDAREISGEFKSNEVRAKNKYTAPFRLKGSIESVTISLGKPLVSLDAGDRDRVVITGLREEEVSSLNKRDSITVTVEKANELLGDIYVDVVIVNKNYLPKPNN